MFSPGKVLSPELSFQSLELPCKRNQATTQLFAPLCDWGWFTLAGVARNVHLSYLPLIFAFEKIKPSLSAQLSCNFGSDKINWLTTYLNEWNFPVPSHSLEAGMWTRPGSHPQRIPLHLLTMGSWYFYKVMQVAVFPQPLPVDWRTKYIISGEGCALWLAES